MTSDTFFNQLKDYGWRARKLVFIRYKESCNNFFLEDAIERNAKRETVYCFDSEPLKLSMGDDFEFALKYSDL